ncbi:MAG TPA: NAD(P)-binding protein, partial [Alphaproteobacteria bacterium]|nr:NAD(P)-binding protein [Alphaproteobacteria bacterium]
KQSDMTPVLDLTREKGAGPFRTRRPVYADLLPPCNNACPAGENIQAWLALAQAGKFRAAWETLVRDNPLPAVHGRVCYHPCERACNRDALDAAVSIHAVERYLGDLAAAEGWRLPIEAPASGKRVLVVGAGPSGLSAAYHLARLGHAVEIHEAGPVAGGMMHFGIPAYRLPRADLMKEIRQIEAMGVAIVLNHKVEDVLAERQAGRFDAVFIAIGAHVSRHVEIPARDAVKVLDAVALLRGASAGEVPRLGRRVVVYGGGNTAMDAARTAKRLGADEALIIYRRDRAHMPARAFEADEALEEGVKIKWLTSIKEIVGPSLSVERMTLDEKGRPQPSGEIETLEADAVVLALGQETESAFLERVPGIEFQSDGTVIVGPDMMTGHAGIFAGGDMVPGERTVTVAVGHGKLAARNIDGWLSGKRYVKPAKHAPVSFEMLNLPMFSDADPSAQKALSAAERLTGFEEVMAGLSEPEARYEAQRCLSCGNCFECDNCYAACPEDAIIKLGPGRRYRFEYDNCTGCAVCFEQCPCHAIGIIAEPG